MIYQSPDDPNRVSADFIRRLDADYPPGTWIAQPKYDGWRRPVYISDGKFEFYSKRGGGEQARKQPPSDLVKELEGMRWPDECALDMEWMGPRCKDELRDRYGPGYNGFMIFDILYVDGYWQGRVPFKDRLESLKSIFAVASAGIEVPRIALAPTYTGSLAEAFEESKRDPLVEGIVVRRSSSGLIGGRSPKKNPGWMKVKYREIKEAASF